MPEVAAYPESTRERNAWVSGLRGAREPVMVERPVAFFHEEEPDEEGRVRPVATILIANRECPWKCVMCDLWRNTTRERVAPGRIPEQIEYALERLPRAEVIKLYNSGSFFDSGAIPREDWEEIAAICRGFERVVVECHPMLINEQVGRFRDLLGEKLEVAMGLETVHEGVLEKLNKGITLRDFERAAKFLGKEGIDVRAFLLVGLPWIEAEEQGRWLERSIRGAFEFGSAVVSLIPTRSGNGSMDELGRAGVFVEPKLRVLEAGLEYGLGLRRGRVFADLWDLGRFSQCADCFERRRERLGRMNLSQQVEPRITCEACDG